MVTTQTIRRRARRFNDDGDGLALNQIVGECCDQIDRLHRIMAKVAKAWLEWGPTDDGTPQGLRLEESLRALLYAVPRRLKEKGKL
ncbi:MAG: hypothetical protein KGL39_35825 [Patescibacteria group bacterium]|nr:hypothetical protein [Patescibacteria group bacterium]